MSQTEAAAPDRTNAGADARQLREALLAMAAFAREAGDEEQSEKFGDLAAKLDRGILTVAFCGHFSAGKSTLVNTICGKNLLPSSPIPTSANVVTIAGGEPRARMKFRDPSGAVTQEREIPVDELHDFAVDGEGVASIEVTYPIPLLGGQMAIVDTPGVDSTDAAHRAATESALHLADVVFYVTDYNHVLSDVNFNFLRSLAEWGKPTYLIVNQIDKHREAEVPFAAFRKGILEALETWKIHPAGLMFLSLRVPEHPLSQWDELVRLLERLKPMRESLMVRSAARSAIFLADRFREALRARRKDEREALLSQIGAGEEDFRNELARVRQRLAAELDALRSAGAARKEALRAELDRLLENANITPAETRDKAAEVLASLQPGFKVGWFGSAAKTESERARRLEALAADLNRQITAHLGGHVKELLRKAAREAGWDGDEMEEALDRLVAPVTPEWLRSKVKPGMGADGQATLNFSADISAEIKGMYRRAALEWHDRLEALRGEETGEAERKLLTEMADLERREAAALKLEEMEREDREQAARLLALLPDVSGAGELALPAPKAPDEQAVRSGERMGAESAAAASAAAAAPAVRDASRQDEELTLGAPEEAIAMLEKAADILSRVPALAKTAGHLADKAAQFRSRRFTIALFGAFSAGKSSFANALVGRPVLPVSPNPTTATINRIVAPSDGHPDGTAWITMKSREAMIEDICHSLRRLGISQGEIDKDAGSPEKLLALAANIRADEVHPRGKPHLAFLKAAAEGWSVYGGLLGTRFNVSGEEYRRYAAEEQASCYVAEIDLAADSPLTRAGAILVDTPGADSINARHTGVAFEYIKNSDAVFFVTYYNHAFTEADRQFLNQLGSVKDVFELDKMFFVINAADLASSAEELDAVKAHVEAQLLRHGIRLPRLFAVSSLRGLEAKLSQNRALAEEAGLTAFEEAFRAFAQSELGELAAAAARKEIERAGLQLESWLAAASAGAAAREEKARRLLELAQTWREKGRQDVPGKAVQPLLQEIAEQMYHLRQRVYFRFGEHFQAAFHPSVLQDDGRDLRKLLVSCWDDLKRGVGEDLQQELRAASLRLEVTLQRLVGERLDAASAELAAEGFAAEPADRPKLDLPAGDPFAAGPDMDAKRLWQAFKSPKHFFEQNGKNALREQAAELLFAAADRWLESLREEWNGVVTETYRAALREAYAAMAADLAEYAERLGQSMLDPDETNKLLEIRAEWSRLAQGV